MPVNIWTPDAKGLQNMLFYTSNKDQSVGFYTAYKLGVVRHCWLTSSARRGIAWSNQRGKNKICMWNLEASYKLYAFIYKFTQMFNTQMAWFKYDNVLSQMAGGICKSMKHINSPNHSPNCSRQKQGEKSTANRYVQENPKDKVR